MPAAHAAGIVHRDIKPANLLVAKTAWSRSSTSGSPSTPSRPDAGTRTQTGVLVGTPHYMSPEQCNTEPADQRSDLYALGAAYYTMLTGAAPYQDRGSAVQVMFAHCHADPPDPRNLNASVPEACAAVVARAMAKKPEHRYQHAREMLQDLDAIAAMLSGSVRFALPSQSGVKAASSRASQIGTIGTVADAGRGDTVARSKRLRLAAIGAAILGLAKLDAGDLGNRIPVVGRLERTCQKCALLDRLRRVLGIDARRSQERATFDAALIGALYHAQFDHEIVAQEGDGSRRWRECRQLWPRP